MNESFSVPKILLCGDKSEFLARIDNRPFEIVGLIKFFNDGKISVDEKFISQDELRQLINGKADYIVISNNRDFGRLRQPLSRIIGARAPVVSLSEFINLPTSSFRDVETDRQLMKILQALKIKTLIDLDAHFAKSHLLTKVGNNITEIDCVTEEKILPIKENIYTHVYKKISDCQFKHYDAALVYGKNGMDFLAEFSAVEDMADLVITFARNNFKLEKFIVSNVKFFEKVNFVTAFAGKWLLCYRHKPPEKFTIYVVTHKILPKDHVEKLPEGYKIIHAGKVLSKDFGYLGDDTGRGGNISFLNPYLNELTALYWMWKNSSDTIIGLAHYRRFLTDSHDENFSHEKILTEDAAKKILRDYDIIVTGHFDDSTQYDNILFVTTENLLKYAIATLKKNLTKNFPDYIEMFDKVMNARYFFKCSIFVTRRNIFDAYCSWIFSFITDTCKDFVKILPPNVSDKQKRLIGFLGERLLTVWLMKNNLRIKTLGLMTVPNL